MYANKASKQRNLGQGLVEYALLLALVSVVVIGFLSQLSTEVNDAICEIVTTLRQGDEQEECDGIGVDIVSSNYDGSSVTIHATFDGGYDNSVTLTAHPGGTMSRVGNEYVITFAHSCPCDVRIASDSGSFEIVHLP